MFVKFVSKLIKKMRAFTKHLCYLLLFCMGILMSCESSGSTKQVDLNDIRPKARAQQQNKSEEISKDTLRAFYNYYANDSAQLGIAKIAPDTLLKTHFLDRFSQAKLRLLLTDSSGQAFAYHHWSFPDSVATMEAFYNWLDQAGKQQQSVQLGVGDILHATHGLYIVSEHEIFFLQSKEVIRYTNWLKWFQGKADTSPIYFVMRMKPKQKTKWFHYTNTKLTPL